MRKATCTALGWGLLVIVLAFGPARADDWAIEDFWSAGAGWMGLSVPGETGVYFRVQASERLEADTWSTRSLVLGVSGSQAIPVGEAATGGACFVRVHRIDRSQPMDEDADGIDDVFELQRAFLDAMSGSDASADYDFDGWSNLYEYENDTEPGVRDDTGVALTIYANGLSGDDANDGLAPASSNGHGPKQSVNGLFDAAFDGDTLSLAEGAYTVATISMASRSLTLRPEGNVTFQ